jgi:glycosyltransferase involved in cell wall biosynthesis
MNSANIKVIALKVRRLFYLKSTSIFDFILFQLQWPVSNFNSRGFEGKKLVVFIGEFLPPRIPRISKWLKRTDPGFATFLLCHKSGFVEKFSNESFDQILLFRNAWHLRRIIRAFPAMYIMHGFAPKSYFPDIARKMAKCPYIHDMQDVFSIYYGLNPTLNWLKKELPHEKECLTKADGIVAHSLEPNVGLRKYHVKPKPKTLFFPLYCDNDFFRVPSREYDKAAIHIVYAGGVTGSHRDSRQYGSTQFHELIKLLSGQKIHFHIYPSPSNIRADYEEYEGIAKGNEYFHFHVPVHQNELTAELSRYDFGILPFFNNQTEQSDEKYKYATTLKLFNYIEAGIPVLVSRDIIYQNWILTRYKCGISIDKSSLEDINALLSGLDYSGMKKEISKSREVISMERQIGRLIKFYAKLKAV